MESIDARAYPLAASGASLDQVSSLASGLNTQLATLKANEGFTLLFLAENYCNGLPLWDGKDETNVETVTLSTTELYAAAVIQFDSALTLIGTADPQIRRLALVGKARTIVDQAKAGGQAASYAAAAALVGEVPTGYVFNAAYSASSQGMENGLYDWGFNTPNWGASNAEGCERRELRPGEGSARQHRSGENGRLSGRYALQHLQPLQQARRTRGTRHRHRSPSHRGGVSTCFRERRRLACNAQSSPFDAPAVRHGDDERRRPRPKTYPDDNVLRAGLAPLADPGTPESRISLHFRERGFWLYLTAHRLGDFRRLIRQYGRNAEAVFPTGAYFKGGAYGTDVVLPPNNTETNNPNWKICTDKLP